VSDLSHGEEWNNDENAIGFGFWLRAAKISFSLGSGEIGACALIHSAKQLFMFTISLFFAGYFII
jgi:hypothetical protein